MTRRKNDKAPESGGKGGGAVRKKANPLQYLGQVRQEARKVTWTSRQETIVSTIMVLILSLIAMLFFWGVDTGIQFTVRSLLALGSGA